METITISKKKKNTEEEMTLLEEIDQAFKDLARGKFKEV